MILTNLGAVDASTSLGTVTGDLRGSVAATVLSVAPGKGGTTVFTVQHHWTTESGDTLDIPVAKATTVKVLPELFAVLSYPFTIVGGTGKFDRATGRFETMGEVDLNAGHTVFRYKGELCFGGREDRRNELTPPLSQIVAGRRSGSQLRRVGCENTVTPFVRSWMLGAPFPQAVPSNVSTGNRNALLELAEPIEHDFDPRRARCELHALSPIHATAGVGR